MKVILLTDIAKIGRKYDVKEVSAGYARNYLFPRNLAEQADTAKEKNIALLQKQAEEERKLQEELLEKNISALKGVTVHMKGKANEQGHLFQGIHADEIAEALKKEAGIDVRGDMIEPSEPIKSVGTHTLTVAVGEQKGEFTLDVDGEV